MPWVRIDQNAMQHPKIRGLSDGAFRLWVEGLAYCQMFLTDGQIATIALKGLQAFSQKRRDDLLTAGLWKPATDGCLVHDYLEWNDSRAQVVTARKLAKERIAKKRGSQLVFGERSSDVRANTTDEQPASVPCECVSEERKPPELREGGTGETDLPRRAGDFGRWYEDAHQRVFGIGYMGTNGDFQKSRELCQKFTDQQLRDAAMFWFGQDDEFANTGTRSIAKFASRISGVLQAIKARGLA